MVTWMVPELHQGGSMKSLIINQSISDKTSLAEVNLDLLLRKSGCVSRRLSRITKCSRSTRRQ